MSAFRTRVSAIAVAFCLSAAASPCWAQESGPAGPAEPLPPLAGENEVTAERIRELEARIEALEVLLDAAVVSREAQAEMRGRGVQAAAAQPQTPSQPVPSRDQPETSASAGDRKTPAPSDAVEAVAQREQGYFGQRFSTEVGVSYAHFDDARVNLSGFLALDAIFLGLISIDETRADVVTTDFTARMGIDDRLQFDVNVPYLVRRSYYQSGGAGGNASGLVAATVWDAGLGDVSFGASYRLLTETFTRPDVVANVRVKAPTGRHPFGIELVDVAGSEGNLKVPEELAFGTGVWSSAVGVSVLKSLDPLVVFGSINYFRNFEESFVDIDEAPGDQPGRVKLGDSIQYGAGVAFALNERSSLSTSFTQRFVRGTRLRRDEADWQTVIGSDANVALMNFGATFALAEKVSLLGSVSIGMTADAPDMVVSIRLPIRY